MPEQPKRRAGAQAASAESFAHRVLTWWLPILYLLISSLFYLRTYDSAQVKITVMQMGGLALLVLWLARLIEARGAAFTKKDLVCLSPFLAYLLVGILSFLHAPYHMASVDFFLRHFFFMVAALIAIYELNAQGVERLSRILILAGWIAIGYGFLQFLDLRWFPSGIGKGIDPFIWRGAFGDRVFSTYGNPNFFADFLVILFPILLTQYLKTRRKILLPLLFMLLVDLVATGTKGAWLGFAMVLFFLGVIAFLYFPEQVAPYRKPVLGLVTAGVLGFVGFVAKDLQARIVSVNFRLFTWEATWEMIMTQPLIGTGVGSFPPIYPAFRRPPIFHIEGKHNTETDHAENEYLEQLFDNGILGFGVFLWLIISTLVVGFRSLGQMTTLFKLKEGRAPPRAYDLVGYLVALMGMLGHNFFDVSLRFVSSGVYLGLLTGMIVNLARGRGLYELHKSLSEARGASDAPSSFWKVLSEFLIWPARLAAWAGLAYVGFLILQEFSYLQGPLQSLSLGGEVLQWWLAWGVLVGCVASLSWIFARLVYLSENPLVSLLVLAALQPLYLFWGYFKADIHHNVAIAFSKVRNWEKALEHYLLVRKHNPDFVMSRYFMGNVFNDRFDMRRIYNPAWGDQESLPRDDYERALDSYNEVRRLAPNYVQTHHQVGALHLKRAEWASSNGRSQEVGFFLDRAIRRFKLYQQIDPVFALNYFRLYQVYMIQRRYAEAAKAMEDLIQAPMCAVDPRLIAKPFLRNSILSYQGYVQQGAPVHRHESADAYTNLGNAYFMLERLPEAEGAYRRALALDPNFELAKKNLTVVYQKAQALGRLKAVPSLASPTPGATYTGYEVIPSKK